MKLRNKISRRAQLISAIAVALFFGGGWLMVWKWPHLKLRYMMFRAAPELKAAMAKRAQWLTLPDSVPAAWIQLDLGIVSLDLPGSIEKFETKDSKAVIIDTSLLSVVVPEYFSGREISEDLRNAHAQLLGPKDRWRDAGYVEFCHAAGFASSDDFRWDLSLDEVHSLQHLLFFKAMNAGEFTKTFHFDGPYSKGIMTWVPPGALSNFQFGYAPTYAAAMDDQDSVVFWFMPKSAGGEHLVAAVISSVRFPEKRYCGSAEDLTRHLESLATKMVAATQPAQP